MNAEEMARLFRAHREAEARRDYDAVIDTFTEDCYLETVALGLRSQGREAARAAYVGYFTAFPDLAPEDLGTAFGEDVMVAWGFLRGTSGGDWMGVPPSGGSFAVPFTNVAVFKNALMAGESIYFDLATLCEQAGLPIDQIRAAAKGTRRIGSSFVAEGSAEEHRQRRRGPEGHAGDVWRFGVRVEPQVRETRKELLE
jgi:steroid delta-isomerase-like uncharacterized protein